MLLIHKENYNAFYNTRKQKLSISTNFRFKKLFELGEEYIGFIQSSGHPEHEENNHSIESQLRIDQKDSFHIGEAVYKGGELKALPGACDLSAGLKNPFKSALTFVSDNPTFFIPNQIILITI